MATKVATAGVDASIDIKATPRVVIDAFFDGPALEQWWGAARSVTTARTLGPYAIEWPTREERDEVLGRLGGVLRGTVVQIEPTRGFLVADVFWLPPMGNPIGPMALEVSCRLGVSADGMPATKVRVTQGGFEESVRWRRYYDVMYASWMRALESLKMFVEKDA